MLNARISLIIENAGVEPFGRLFGVTVGEEDDTGVMLQIPAPKNKDGDLEYSWVALPLEVVKGIAGCYHRHRARLENSETADPDEVKLAHEAHQLAEIVRKSAELGGWQAGEIFQREPGHTAVLIKPKEGSRRICVVFQEEVVR